MCAVAQRDGPTHRLPEDEALGALFDRFLVHSDYYRDYMAGVLELDRDKMQVVPLGIDAPVSTLVNVLPLLS